MHIMYVFIATVVPMDYPLPLKAQIFLIKLIDKYHGCCHSNGCAYGIPTSFKTGYVISNVFVSTGCVDFYYLYTLHSSIHIKVTEIPKFLK